MRGRPEGRGADHLIGPFRGVLEDDEVRHRLAGHKPVPRPDGKRKRRVGNRHAIHSLDRHLDPLPDLDLYNIVLGPPVLEDTLAIPPGLQGGPVPIVAEGELAAPETAGLDGEGLAVDLGDGLVADSVRVVEIEAEDLDEPELEDGKHGASRTHTETA